MPPTMTVALNLGSLRGLGSAAVGRSILSELVADPNSGHFLAWVPSEWHGTLGDVPHVRYRYVGKGLRQKLLTDQVRIRRAFRTGQAAKLFSLNDTSMVACRNPHLLLLHQPNLVAPPDHLDFPCSRSYALRLHAMRAYLGACLRTVDVVTVQTAYMKEGLVEQWGYPADRVWIVPSAVQDVPGTLGTWRPMAGDPPYVLYPASAAAHKNHVILVDMVRSLERWGRQDVRCAITVEPDQLPLLVSAARRAGVQDRFTFLGRRPAQEIRELMATAAAVVIPSKLESFGLPYYEAMGVGCPLVVADRGFAREACGDAARYCPADSGAAFGAAVAELLEDTDAATDLSRRGMNRYGRARRSWGEITAEYLRILAAL